MRTTETKGVKLIYNGKPKNGTCNNTSTSTQIGTSAYSSNVDSMAYVGYMYNTVYSSTYLARNKIPSNLMLGQSFSYSNGEYTLKYFTTASKWTSVYNKMQNYFYTCLNSTGKCSTLYYIYYSSYNGMKYISLKNGKSVNDAMYEMLWADNVNKKNSTIKTKVDNWYKSYMKSYTKYLEDAVYCNDRSILNKTGAWTMPGDIYLNPYLYFYTYNYYDLTCENKNDQFTVNEENGNGALTYPVGLLSQGEAYYWGKATSKTGSTYWTMSPYMFNPSSIGVPSITTTGSSYISNGEEIHGVRPVVSLKDGMKVSTGTGTTSDPYIIETN